MKDEAISSLLRELAGLKPGQRTARLMELGDPVLVLADLAEEAQGVVIGDLDLALDATAALVELADHYGAARGRAREVRARALAYANRFDEALATLEKSVALAEETGDALGAARARLEMLHALGRLGRYDEAVAAGEAARQVFLERGERFLAARAEINLGVTHRARCDPQRALQHFEDARPAVIDKPAILAQLDSNRAVALLDLNRFSDAEQAFNSALRSFEATGLSRGAAIVEGNLADLMSRQGRLPGALYHFERARRAFQADGRSPGDQARVAAEQADAFAAAGLLEEACGLYQDAIPCLDEHGLRWEAARARTGLGEVLARLGQLDRAQTELAHAARAFGDLGHEVGLGRVRLAFAPVALARGDASAAIELLRSAGALLHERPAETALAALRLALVALERGERDEAAAPIESAVAAAERLQLAPLLADALHARARLSLARGDRTRACADLRAAVAEVEKVRGTLQADRLRAAFAGERTAVYQDLVRLLLDDRRPERIDEAFLTIERARSRALLDLVAGAIDHEALVPAAGADPVEARLVGEALELRRELNALYSRVFDTGSRAFGADQRWREEVERCGQRLQLVESRLASTRGVCGVLAAAVGGPEVREMLHARSALVEYFLAGEELLALVLRRDGIEAFRGLASGLEVAEQVERVHFEMGRAIGQGSPEIPDRLVRDVQQELAELYGLVWAPLAAALRGAERVHVVPAGPLHAAPFAALHDGERYLIEQHEIVMAPSASVLREVLSGDAAPAGAASALILAVADEATPRIEDEARAVAASLPGARLYLGAEATVARLRSEGPAADIIHLACHGRFVAGRPLSSGLRLGEGWMTVRDLFGLGLRGGLVVLSGCDTGACAVGGGEEVMGLVRGFLAAGADSLIMSLWPVHDESALETMAAVYSLWHNTPRQGSLMAALRAAQRQVMARRPHPVFWAPFVLVGKP